VLGYSEKLNLAYAEKELVAPGGSLPVIETRFGRLGVLIGQDIMYPELARLLAIQGADLLIGIAAIPGPAAGAMVRRAMALRTEENQIFGAASFLVGPNLLGQENVTDYHGQSALLAPISLTVKGDGVLIETGTDRTEGIITAELDMDGLYDLRQTSHFRPRQEMNLGNLGPVLAEMYEQGLNIEQATEQHIAGPVEAIPEPEELEPELPEEAEAEPEAGVQPAPEPEAEGQPEPGPEAEGQPEPGPEAEGQPEPEPAPEEEPEPRPEPARQEAFPSSIPEAMSLTDVRKVDE
jgi:hypothetical protein